MSISIDVKRKFKINGKEYNSVEEMPDEIRMVFEKAMALRASGAGQRTHSAVMRSKIVFNGKEYENVLSMPQDIRQLSGKVLKAAKSAVASSGVDIPGGSEGMLRKPDTTGTARPGEIRNPTKAESSFSPRMLLMGAGLIILILLLYLLIQNR